RLGISVGCSRCGGGPGGYPTVGTGVVTAAGIQKTDVKSLSTPDDHFTASPDCRVRISGSGRVGRTGGDPTVSAGTVSVAGIEIIARVVSAPDDHFTASPHCGGQGAGIGRVGKAGGCPTVGGRMISAASVKISANINPTPDDHFAAGPHCCVIRSASGRASKGGWSPGVIGAGRKRLRAVSAAVVQKAAVAPSAPDDHLAPGPYCRVEFSATGCAGAAGGCPTI